MMGIHKMKANRRMKIIRYLADPENYKIEVQEDGVALVMQHNRGVIEAWSPEYQENIQPILNDQMAILWEAERIKLQRDIDRMAWFGTSTAELT